MENPTNNARMQKCPSFDGCSAPKCPLDEFIAERVRYADEPKCPATKRTRLLLAHDLKFKGLTAQEYMGIMSHYGTIEAYLKRFLGKTPIQIKYKTLRRLSNKATIPNQQA